MEYLYGALLLHKAGKEITEDAMEKTLAAAGIKVDKARIKATVTALQGVDINKVLSETQVAAPAAEAPKAEGKPEGEAKPKKEEPSPEEKEKSEEEAAAGLGALFG